MRRAEPASLKYEKKWLADQRQGRRSGSYWTEGRSRLDIHYGVSVVMPLRRNGARNRKLLAWRKKQKKKRMASASPRAPSHCSAIEDGQSGSWGSGSKGRHLAGMTAAMGAVIPLGQTMAWLVGPGEKPPGNQQSGRLRARQVVRRRNNCWCGL